MIMVVLLDGAKFWLSVVIVQEQLDEVVVGSEVIKIVNVCWE